MPRWARTELSEWLLKRSWKSLHKHRWVVAFVLVLVAQASVYRDLKASAAPPAHAVPAGPGVIAESPDHAGLVEKLEVANTRVIAVEKERDKEQAARVAAEQRVRELERKLVASAQRTAACDHLAALSAVGRPLVTKLRANRAAPETRKEIDQWYAAVCEAMAAPQCEAFRGAPRASGNWANYPVDDGGYSQTLRGRSEYLSGQLPRLCS